MPQSSEIIEKSIPVYSAREDYEHTHPLNTTAWKEYAFLDLMKKDELNL